MSYPPNFGCRLSVLMHYEHILNVFKSTVQSICIIMHHTIEPWSKNNIIYNLGLKTSWRKMDWGRCGLTFKL